MSKVILVIDKPNNCSECPCCNNSECGNQYKGYIDDYLEWNSGMPSWCPLKPLPQRKIVGEIEKVDDFMKSELQIINEKVTAQIMLNTELLLASGYNLCLDEILGNE